MVRRLHVWLLALAVLAACCAGCGHAGGPGTGGPDELFGEIASYETVAGVPSRVMVGMSTNDGRILGGGDVELSIAPASGGKPTIRATAHYISLPGVPAVPSGPRIGRMSQGIGVYAAVVTVPSPGFWTVRVSLPGELAKQHPEASFEALRRPRVPTVGEVAPRTRNLTLASPGVQLRWLDSVATADEPPDPLLHTEVIADAIAAHRPVVVVVSTPAYCQTRFCGFTLEAIRELAERDKKAGSDRAYVHLEVWRDYEKKVVNAAASEWIQARNADGQEPWVFVVGRDGRIAARFDNVAPTDQLTAAIDAVK